jgi:hypothetical protein
MTKREAPQLPTMLVIGALIINLGYVTTKSRNLVEFIGSSIGHFGGLAAICYIIAKITARNNPAGFRLHFGWSFVIFSLLVIFGNIYLRLRA